MMKLLSTSILIFSQVASSYGACFIPESITVAKKAIDLVGVDTQRECELACEANTQCVSVRYNTTSKSCVLENNEDVQSCATSRTHFIKVVVPSGTAKRTDPMAEMGVDPCVTKYHPELTKFNGQNICPPRNLDGTGQPLLALRGVLENGTRVTLSDEYYASLSYDACTDTWVYSFKSEDVTSEVRLLAVTCAEFDNTKCPCPQLPFPNIPGEPYVPVTFDKAPACPEWTVVKELHRKSQIGHHMTAFIGCKAGAWFISFAMNPPEKKEYLITEGGCPKPK